MLFCSRNICQKSPNSLKLFVQKLLSAFEVALLVAQLPLAGVAEVAVERERDLGIGAGVALVARERAHLVGGGCAQRAQIAGGRHVAADETVVLGPVEPLGAEAVVGETVRILEVFDHHSLQEPYSTSNTTPISITSQTLLGWVKLYCDNCSFSIVFCFLKADLKENLNIKQNDTKCVLFNTTFENFKNIKVNQYFHFDVSINDGIHVLYQFVPSLVFLSNK